MGRPLLLHAHHSHFLHVIIFCICIISTVVEEHGVAAHQANKNNQNEKNVNSLGEEDDGDSDAVRVSTLINDKTETLMVPRHSEPYHAASVFCAAHDIHVSLEGTDSTTLLAEEVISRGGRFVPWLNSHRLCATQARRMTHHEMSLDARKCRGNGQTFKLLTK